MENENLATHNVPENPEPNDSPTQFFIHILRGDQSTPELKLKDPTVTGKKNRLNISCFNLDPKSITKCTF